MPFLYTECISTTSDRQRGWRLLAGIINVQKYQQLFLAALGEAQAGKWLCCGTRGARCHGRGNGVGSDGKIQLLLS